MDAEVVYAWMEPFGPPIHSAILRNSLGTYFRRDLHVLALGNVTDEVTPLSREMVATILRSRESTLAVYKQVFLKESDAIYWYHFGPPSWELAPAINAAWEE